MNDSTPGDRKPPSIKGSWEDLLEQADEHAANFNDAAIPLYQRVFDGLLKLSPAARRTASGKLHDLLMHTAFAYQGYLNILDRFDESLAVCARLQPVLEDELDKKVVRTLQAQICQLAGRHDQAIAILHELAQAPGATLADWQSLLMTYVHAGRAAEALELIPTLYQVAEAEAASTPSGDGADDLNAQSKNLRSPHDRARSLTVILQMEAGRLTDALQTLDTWIAQDNDYAGNAYLVYSRLAQLGDYEQALRLIDYDRAHIVRSSYWRGVILDRLGQHKRAHEAYAIAANPDSYAQDQRSVLEHFLAQFALGDPEAQALQTLLSLLRDRRATGAWIFHMLVGLGWIVRGDWTAARANLRVAVAQIRRQADGLAIPSTYWFLAQGFIPAERQAEFRRFFEEPRRTNGSAQSVNASHATTTPEDTPASSPSEAA